MHRNQLRGLRGGGETGVCGVREGREREVQGQEISHSDGDRKGSLDSATQTSQRHELEQFQGDARMKMYYRGYLKEV